MGRETVRRYGNGVRQLTSYDEAGRTKLIVEYASSSELTRGEGYVYDAEGRRAYCVNESGSYNFV